MKEITLIKPNSKNKNYQELSNSLTAIAPPLWMSFRAAQLEYNGYHVTVIDSELDDFDINNIADDVELFPSGNHSSAYYQEQEGINALRLLLLEKNKNVKVWTGLPQIDFNLSPAWNHFNMSKYRAHNWHCWNEKYIPREPYGIVCSSYGCPFKCNFCTINDFYGSGFQERDLVTIFNEIKELVEVYNVKNIKFIDELFLFNMKRIDQLCDMIIAEGYNLNMWAYAKIDIMSGHILEKLKKAGMNWLGTGIESGDEDIRSDMMKGRYSNRQIKDKVQMMKDYGIAVCGAFIFGFMNDNYTTMLKTLDFAKELMCEMSSFHSMMAYPGSTYYNVVKELGWYIPQKWSEYSQFSYDSHPVRTKYLNSSAVLQFRDYAFQSYFTDERYLSMIRKRFNDNVVDDINNVTKIKLKRRLYES